MHQPFSPNSLFTSTLPFQSSSISFSPLHTNIFLIGTYNLDDKPSNPETTTSESTPQSRSGSILLFRLEESAEITHFQTHDLSLRTEGGRSAGAILDLRFCPNDGWKDIVAVGTSTGLVLVFRLRDDLLLELLRVISIFKEKEKEEVGVALVTSLSWNPAPCSSGTARTQQIAVTGSDGRVAVVALDLSPGDLGSRDGVVWLHAMHDEAAWIVEWLPAPQLVSWIMTGGDDAAIHILLPSPPGPDAATAAYANDGKKGDDTEKREEEVLHPIALHQRNTANQSGTHMSDSKTHSAGVTAILPLSLAQSTSSSTTSSPSQTQQIIATGSYDQSLRILSTPPLNPDPDSNHASQYSIRRWGLLAEKDLGGGVWRIVLLDTTTTTFTSTSASTSGESKKKEERKWLLLIACMHSGAKIVEISHCIDNTFSPRNGRDEEDEDEDEEEWGIKILAHFEGHGSMCYAACAKAMEAGTGRRMWRVVSTSFYDRLVCVWDFEWI